MLCAHPTSPVPAPDKPISPPSAPTLPLVLPRKYVAELRPGFGNELSARIEHEGQAAFFPLSTDDPVLARRRAVALQREVTETGWRAASASHVREFTLAIFWLPNPLTCTYASLYSTLQAPPPHDPAGLRVRVALLEPDPEIRWALVRWLNHGPEFHCASAHGSLPDLLADLDRARPDVVLFDAPPCTPSSTEIQARLAADFPAQVAFPFGIYRDSEHAWYCVTGMDGGYFYRRRPPAQLLEPITGLWHTQMPSREAVESQIRHHFQTLLGLRVVPADAFPGLTRRERDVLLGLRRGHTDKSLATLLGVSVWTVHTHMKSVFEKLGVHTRAEAVAKFFEK